jgi:OOP family OmpA-OmpF porin
MKSSRTLRLLTLATLAPLAASPVLAQDSYNYGGLSLGNSYSRMEEQRTADSVLGVNGPAVITGRDRAHFSYRLFGGHQFNRYFGVEAAFFDLGNFGFAADAPGGKNLQGTLKQQGIGIDAVGTWPITERFSLVGRLGGTYAKSRNSFTGTATIPNASPSNREGNPKGGLGMQYAFNPSFLMRAEVERYRVSDAVGHRGNVDRGSISLVFPFGRSEAPMRQAKYEPAYMAPAPAIVQAPEPAPIIVVAAPPAPPVVMPERRRVAYSAESMFGFDASTIRPEGAQQLDAFAIELAGARFDNITVEGHTDRLGTTEYNQALSQRRADAVKEYLVNTGKVDGSKITAVGKSESTPVTKADECKGNKATAKLVSCLQPDRRVEIEVVGTR